jgi:hypothetical protein
MSLFLPVKHFNHKDLKEELVDGDTGFHGCLQNGKSFHAFH